MTSFLYPFLVALGIAFAITPVVKRFALRVGALTEPNSRSVHTVPTPHLGGVAIFVAFAAATLLFGRFPQRELYGILAGGAFSVVLELVPAQLSKLVSERLRIPTIGIGAGPDCDGQVQVFHDLLGLFAAFAPKHARRYADAGDIAQKAVEQYVSEVTRGQFPTMEHSFSLSDEVLKALAEEKN